MFKNIALFSKCSIQTVAVLAPQKVIQVSKVQYVLKWIPMSPISVLNGFLRRNLLSCPQDVKEAACKGLVRPVLEYGSSVWGSPRGFGEGDNRAARFVTRNYTFEEGSMTGILEQLKWESLRKRRTDNRLILLYKGLKGKARIQMTLSQRLDVVQGISASIEYRGL